MLDPARDFLDCRTSVAVQDLQIEDSSIGTGLAYRRARRMGDYFSPFISCIVVLLAYRLTKKVGAE